MAQLALAVVGSAIGAAIGGPFGAAALGQSLGWLVGSAAGALLGGGQKSKGPRASDTQVQVSTYGHPIYKIWGTARVAGDIIWIGERKRKKKEVSAKGLGGGSSAYFEYRQSFAVGFSEPACNVLKIWFHTKLVYDTTGGSKIRWKYPKTKLRFYYGREDAQPDPLIEAERGIDHVPAFRHLNSIMFENQLLKDFSNQIPNVRALVVTKCERTRTATVITGFQDLMLRDSLVPDRRPGQPYAFAASGPQWPQNTWLYRIDLAAEKIDIQARTAYPWSSFGPGDTSTEGFWFAQDNQTCVGGACVSNTLTYARTAAYPFDLDTLQGLAVACGSVVCTAGYVPPVDWMRSGFFRASQFDPTLMAHVEDTDLNNGNIDIFRGGGWAYRITSAALLTQAAFGFITTARVQDVDWGPGEKLYILVSGIEVTKIIGDVTTIDLTAELPGATLMRYLEQDNSLLLHNGRKFLKYSLTNRQITHTLDLPLIQNRSSIHGNITPAGTLWFGAVGTDLSVPTPPGSYSFFPRFYEISLANLTIVQDELFTEIGAQYPLQPQNKPFFEPVNALFYPELNAIVAEEIGERAVGIFRFGVAPGCETLQQVVNDLGEMTGQLNVATQTDAGALAADAVCGYIWEQRKTIREGLEQLAAGYFFNGIESDGKIKYKKRNASPVMTIPEEDLAAHEQGEELPVALREVRQQELEFPREIDVIYMNEDRDYDQDNARAQRNARVVSSTERQVFNLPIAFNAAKAQKVVEQMSREMWQERTTYEFTLPPPYRRLDPMDPVEIALDDGTLFTLRLDEINAGANGVFECKGTQIDPAIYQDLPGNDAGPIGGGFLSQRVTVPVPSVLVLVDTPTLRDEDPQLTIYVAAAPSRLGDVEWEGALVLRSVDDQNTWADFRAVETPATTGWALTALAAPRAWTTWDEGNSVDVQLQYGTLFNASRMQVLNLENAALLGSEVIQFRNAVEIDPVTHTWRLSGLARGRRGTDWAINTHVPGERFLLLETESLARVILPLTDLAVQRDYRAVTSGLTLEESRNVTFIWSGNSAKPYSVTMIRGDRDGSDNLTITWLRRSRIGVSWQSGVTPSLAEATEAYEVDVVFGGEVVRTIAVSAATAAYTAAQQGDDGITPGDAVDIIIYQLSATVGRGFPAEATV